MSTTPRTDKAERNWDPSSGDGADGLYNLCIELEDELTEAREMIDEKREEIVKLNKDLGTLEYEIETLKAALAQAGGAS